MEMFLAILASVGLLAIVFGLTVLVQKESVIEDRLAAITARVEPEPGTKKDRGESALAVGIERAVARRPGRAQEIRRLLARADLKLTVAEFLMLQAGGVVLGGLIGLLISQANPIFALLGGFAGYKAPGLYVGRRIGGRSKAFQDQLGETITLMANSLRSGYSLLQSMQMVARESPDPTAAEFNRVVREVGLGLTPEQALSNLVRRINSEDLDMMVTAINVQAEVGGNLSTILETIGHTIRERIRLKGEIQTLTAQQSVAAYIISALPILLGLVLFLMNRDYMLEMFKVPYIAMPICGLISIAIGFTIIRKIVDIKV